MRCTVVLALLASLAACLELDDDLSEDDNELIAANKLAGNKLAGNLIAANKLGTNRIAASSLETRDLMATANGREVMSFIVGCALGSNQSVTLKDPNNISYTYPGLINLAPAWASRAPTVSERRWVSACVLARTNLYGLPVNISMRHDSLLALTTTSPERSAYTNAEGAFYGDLFAMPQTWYACANRTWTQYTPNSFRACALSANGSTTDCGFTYTGMCNSSTCSDRNAPFGSCRGGTTTYAEVVTIFLTPSEQLGGTH
jgi:hypothetical protein